VATPVTATAIGAHGSRRRRAPAGGVTGRSPSVVTPCF
jgi:hypothetical protein